MIKKLLYIISFCLIASFAIAGETHYVTYSGAGSQNGSSMANAFSWADITDDANEWDTDDSDDNKIGPNDTVCLSGNFATGDSINYDLRGSGDTDKYIVFDGSCGDSQAEFINTGYDGTNGVPIDLNGGDWLEFKNINFSGTAWAHIHASSRSDNIKIHDCDFTLTNNPYGISIQGGQNWYIYDNTLSQIGSYESGNGFRIASTSAAISNIYIYRNSISDFGHNAIDIVGRTYNITSIHVYDNVTDLPTKGYGRGFGFGTMEGEPGVTSYIYIYNNHFKNHRAPNQAANMSYIYIYNNIFENHRNCCQNAGDAGCSVAYSNCSTKSFLMTGQAIVVPTAAGPLDHLYIHGNTFYNISESAIQLRDQQDTIDYVSIKNNIIQNAAIYSDGVSEDPDGSTATSTDYAIATYGTNGITNEDIDNNIIYGSDGSNQVRWEGTTQSLNDFAFASSNQEADPKMNNPGSSDFTLQSDSPAIDAGVDLGTTNPSGASKKFDDGWDPDTSLPPNEVDTLEQDSYGDWEIGVFVYDSAEAAGNIRGVTITGGKIN